MSRKGKVQFVAIFFILAAIPLFFYSHNRVDHSYLFSLLSLSVGSLGSIISMFIPSRITLSFDQEKWLPCDDGGYYFTILSKEHKMGISPKFQVYVFEGGLYYPNPLRADCNLVGDITIATNIKVAGKIVVE